MRQITLIKVHPNIQLGHLYEHIFCTQIKKIFYDNGLFKYLDYYLKGTVYDKSGIIEIDLGLYTAEAQALAPQIAQIEISYTPEIISTAFTQLLAEEEQPIATDGLDAITTALAALHDQPWKNIDDFDLFDTKNTRRTSTPIRIADNSSLPSRRLEMRLHLDTEFANSHRELLPLFLQIAKVLAPTAQDALASNNGYYSGEMDLKFSKQHLYMKADMQVAHANDDSVDIHEDLELSKKTFTHITASGSLRRLISELQNLSYTHAPDLSPNIQDVLNETGIYIGTKGWSAIATNDNVTQLLTHMSIEIIFGRKREASRFVEYDH